MVRAAAVAERMRDVLATGNKVIVFCCFQEGITRHRKLFGEQAEWRIPGARALSSGALSQFDHEPGR